jgi:hypothetical protein
MQNKTHIDRESVRYYGLHTLKWAGTAMRPGAEER